MSSPFLLQGTLQHHLQAQSTELAKHIADNIYVDNVSIGATSIPEGAQMYTQAKDIFRSAGMNLREWTSNSRALLSRLPADDLTKAPVTKMLGLTWNTQADDLEIATPSDADLRAASTNRHALHCICKVFDPLGLVNPVFFHGKR